MVSLRTGHGTEAGILSGDAITPVRRLVEERALAFPSGMGYAVLDLLQDWHNARDLLEETMAGMDASGLSVPFEEARIGAPVPCPPSFRDFYAFEEHVARSWERRGQDIPPAWYDRPVFYFSNPSSFVGPRAPIRRPSSTKKLDFELEVAWVMGARLSDAEPGEAEEGIAGLTVLNDFSARDVQREEMSVGLGPSKGKDFATSLGPTLVTLDELEDMRGSKAFDLEMVARVNGEEVSRGNLDSLHYSLGEMTAYASRDTVVEPGDVMGTGTVGTGCVLDLGSDAWLEPGDVVALEVERLGVLENRVVAP